MESLRLEVLQGQTLEQVFTYGYPDPNGDPKQIVEYVDLSVVESASMQFRYAIDGEIVFDLSLGNGIFIIDADGGQFKITISKSNGFKITKDKIFSDLLFNFSDGTSRRILRMIIDVNKSYTVNEVANG